MVKMIYKWIYTNFNENLIILIYYNQILGPSIENKNLILSMTYPIGLGHFEIIILTYKFI